MAIPNPYASAGVVLPTTSTTTCQPTYVSITLNKGNSFVLPPGATLVAVSDRTKVTSDCVDVNGLEQFGCYLFYYNVINNDQGVEEEAQEQVTIWGITIDGVLYEFDTPIIDNGGAGGTTPTGLKDGFNDGLDSVSLSGIIKDLTVSTATPQNADVRLFCFRTLPSIASKMQVKIQDSTEEIVNPFYFLPLFTWATKPDDISSEALNGCLCKP